MDMNDQEYALNSIPDEPGRFERQWGDKDELEKLGEGGFGFTVAVTQDGHTYAVKIIDKRIVWKYIRREISLLLNLKSVYITRVHHYWRENLILYIQMERCDRNLDKILQNRVNDFERLPDQAMTPLEYYIFCELFVELLECVQYLHSPSDEQGHPKDPIIHRDLRPENVLINENPRANRFVKLCDFGLAVVHDKTSLQHTSSTGYEGYIAPEVLNNEKYNVLADVFSLARIAQSLFDLIADTNEIRKIRIHSNLKDVFTQLQRLIGSMQLYPNFRYRPTCDHILDNRKNWMYDLSGEDSSRLDRQSKDLQEQNEFLYKFYKNKSNIR